MYRNANSVRRQGFSLVELLVVIGVIAILAGLLGAAVMKMIPTQQRKNTESYIRRLNWMLQQNWKAVINQAAADYAASRIPAAVVLLAGNDPDRTKVIWTKLRLKQQFPMSYAEAKNPGPGGYISAEPNYVTALGALNTANDPSTEMAACLLMALTKVNRPGVNIDSDPFSALEMRDTDGDGILELVDGWGIPLGFFRWPRRNPDVAGYVQRDANGNALFDAAGAPRCLIGLDANFVGNYPTIPPPPFHDPQDLLGKLQGPAWLGNPPGYTAQSLTFMALCHPLIRSNPPNPSSPSTSWPNRPDSSWSNAIESPEPREPFTVPVVVSAGPDGKKSPSTRFGRFGFKADTINPLYSWMEPDGTGANFDNINGYDVR